MAILPIPIARIEVEEEDTGRAPQGLDDTDLLHLALQDHTTGMTMMGGGVAVMTVTTAHQGGAIPLTRAPRPHGVDGREDNTRAMT